MHVAPMANAFISLILAHAKYCQNVHAVLTHRQCSCRALFIVPLAYYQRHARTACNLPVLSCLLMRVMHLSQAAAAC